MQYTPEQEQDVKDRQEKGLQALKDLQLNPEAIIVKAKLETNGGVNIFADQIIPFLADTKYSVKVEEKTEEKPVENA